MLQHLWSLKLKVITAVLSVIFQDHCSRLNLYPPLNLENRPHSAISQCLSSPTTKLSLKSTKSDKLLPISSSKHPRINSMIKLHSVMCTRKSLLGLSSSYPKKWPKNNHLNNYCLTKDTLTTNNNLWLKKGLTQPWSTKKGNLQHQWLTCKHLNHNSCKTTAIEWWWCHKLTSQIWELVCKTSSSTSSRECLLKQLREQHSFNSQQTNTNLKWDLTSNPLLLLLPLDLTRTNLEQIIEWLMIFRRKINYPLSNTPQSNPQMAIKAAKRKYSLMVLPQTGESMMSKPSFRDTNAKGKNSTKSGLSSTLLAAPTSQSQSTSPTRCPCKKWTGIWSRVRI